MVIKERTMTKYDHIESIISKALAGELTYQELGQLFILAINDIKEYGKEELYNVANSASIDEILYAVAEHYTCSDDELKRMFDKERVVSDFGAVLPEGYKIAVYEDADRYTLPIVFEAVAA